MRKCIFCPNVANSQEHIWSKWILKLLPNAKDGVFTQKLPDGSYISRKAKKPEQTAGVVCKRCNTGWMSTKLEDPMRALTSDIILNNKQKAFSPEDCKHIAKWGFKTTLLSNHMDLGGQPPLFSDESRYAFANDQSIPRGVQVWIAQRNAGHLTATYRSIRRVQQPPTGALTPHLIRPPISPYRFEIYTCTLTVGFLIVQVIAARWTEREVRERLGFPPIFQAEVFESYATAIWPNSGFLVDWPPQRAIDNALFERFWDRFEAFKLPLWMR